MCDKGIIKYKTTDSQPQRFNNNYQLLLSICKQLTMAKRGMQDVMRGGAQRTPDGTTTKRMKIAMGGDEVNGTTVDGLIWIQLDPKALRPRKLKYDDVGYSMFTMADEWFPPHSAITIRLGMAVLMPDDVCLMPLLSAVCASQGLMMSGAAFGSNHRKELFVILNNCTDDVKRVPKGAIVVQFVLTKLFALPPSYVSVFGTDDGLHGEWKDHGQTNNIETWEDYREFMKEITEGPCGEWCAQDFELPGFNTLRSLPGSGPNEMMH